MSWMEDRLEGRDSSGQAVGGGGKTSEYKRWKGVVLQGAWEEVGAPLRDGQMKGNGPATASRNQ